MDKERCRKNVFSGWSNRKCTRFAWRDGYCKQHHPDSVRKRQEESELRWEKKRENSPLNKALKKIAELEAEIQRLRNELSKLR